MKDFVQKALRTESYPHDSTGQLVQGSTLNCLAENLMDIGAAADAVKKGIFYKGRIAHDVEHHVRQMPRRARVQLVCPPNERLVHAALGIITEGIEILEEVVNAARLGRQVDLANLQEEGGDVLWYVALLADATGAGSLENLEELVIAKLAKRYPEKFTEEAALNRDLAAERQVIEQYSEK